MTNCGSCIFWEPYPGDERGLGLCKMLSEGPPPEGDHIAYAEADVNHIGASFTCAPTFGCTLGQPKTLGHPHKGKASDTKTSAENAQPYKAPDGRQLVLEVGWDVCRLVVYETENGRKRLADLLEGPYEDLMDRLDTLGIPIDEIMDCREASWAEIVRWNHSLMGSTVRGYMTMREGKLTKENTHGDTD